MRCPTDRKSKQRKGGVNCVGVGELLKAGKYLEAMELALYTKLLDKLDAGEWDDCRQVLELLEGLSII